MRMEVAGAQITDSVVEVLDTLQNQTDVTDACLGAIDEITRMIITDISGDDADDARRLSLLRALQVIRRDIATLAAPPDADNPANDVPVVQL